MNGAQPRRVGGALGWVWIRTLVACDRQKKIKEEIQINSKYLHRREHYVSEEFGRCRSRKIEASSPSICRLFTENVSINHFEKLIEAEFAKSLQRIPHCCRCPSFGECAKPFLTDSGSESRENTSVFLGIHLQESKYLHRTSSGAWNPHLNPTFD